MYSGPAKIGDLLHLRTCTTRDAPQGTILLNSPEMITVHYEVGTAMLGLNRPGPLHVKDHPGHQIESSINLIDRYISQMVAI